MTGLVLAMVLMAMVLLASPAQAQTAITVPGQIERQFQSTPQPRSQAGRLQVPLPEQAAPAGAEGVRFRLRGLSMDGMTVYPGDSWSAEYTRLIGRQVSLAEIYAFAQTLTARYRNDGYILSQVVVPAQTVEDGYVRVRAVEGYVARVRFEGEAASALLQAQARRIEAERPLTARTLERMLLLMNDVPGVFARAVLLPSATEQGAADLVVQLSRQRVTAGASLDNRGGRALGPWRATLDVEQRGLLGWGDRTGLRYVAADSGELQYVALTHEQALGSDGTRAAVAWSRVRSKPDTGTSFIPLDLETESDSLSLTLSRALLRSRNQNLSLRAAFTAHDGSTSLFQVRETQDRIRAVRLGLTWDLADAARGVNIVDLEFGQGLTGAGASRAGDPELSRAGGKPAFSKLGLYAARLQALGFIGPRWSLLGAFSGQYAFTDLLGPELFSVGGEQFGRGYDPSERVGDHGAAFKLELRYTLAGTAPWGWGYGATAYGFYDAGLVRQRSGGNAGLGGATRSAGMGLRFDLARPLTGYLELAKPLSHVVAAEGNRDLRVYGGLSLRY